MNKSTPNAREGPKNSDATVPGASLRIDRKRAEELVAMYESGNGAEVDPEETRLLERFFLEHDSEADLSHRFDDALKLYEK